jgi:hypothetical protein
MVRNRRVSEVPRQVLPIAQQGSIVLISRQPAF